MKKNYRCKILNDISKFIFKQKHKLNEDMNVNI